MADIDRIYRQIGRALRQFPPAEAAARGQALYFLADLFDDAAETVGNETGSTDAVTAQILRLLADAEWVATGQLSSRKLTDTRWEPLLGGLLDRMAATADVHARVLVVDEIADLVPDDTSETLASLRPSLTLRDFFTALHGMWHARRAA